MSDDKRGSTSIEGHYNYYGVPAYIMKQSNNSYTSGFFDPVEGVFKAGGSVKKVLWDGIKISLTDAKKLIDEYSKNHPSNKKKEIVKAPEWVLSPKEANRFLAQTEYIHAQNSEFLKKLTSDKKDGKKEKS